MVHFESEILDGSVLVLEDSIKQEFKIVVDINTGEVLHMEYVDMSIDKLTKFITHARTNYKKFLNSKAIKDFMD